MPGKYDAPEPTAVDMDLSAATPVYVPPTIMGQTAPPQLGGPARGIPAAIQGPQINEAFLAPSREAQQTQARLDATAAVQDATREPARQALLATQQQAAAQMPSAAPRAPAGPQFAPSSTQFQQAGMQYRPTAEQNALIQQQLGASSERAKLAAEYGPDAIAHQQRIASAMDVEASKARRANEQQALIEQQQQADREEGMAKVREAIDQHAKLAAPDPAQYWRGLGFAGSIGMILADALNTAGAGMKGQEAHSIIDKEIERSLRTQQAQIDKSKENIQQAQGLYGQLRQGGLDQQQAFAAAKARRLEDAAGIVDSYSRQAKTQETQYNLAQQAAELRGRAAQEQLGLYESVMGQGKGKMITTGGGQIGPGSPEWIKQQTALAELRKKNAEAEKLESEASGGGAIPGEVAKETAEMQGLTRAFDRAKAVGGAPTQLQKFGMNWIPGYGWIDPNAFEREAAVANATETIAKAKGMRVTPELLKETRGMISGGSSNPEIVNRGLEQYRQDAAAKQAAYYAALPPAQQAEFRKRFGESMAGQVERNKQVDTLRGGK